MINFRKNQLASVALVLFALAGVYFAATNVKEKGEVASATAKQEEQVNKIKVSIGIDFGESSKILSSQTAKDVEIEEGKTALDLTSEVATIEKTGEGKNAFITAINGDKADSAKNEFWELIINGKSSQVGAGSYTLRDGDKIEWKLSTF